ncbi:SusC/RagA family TonB-linked outer membrane protein [Flavihumibacter petaseus]|uniref:Putative TonB-dependent receptor n=1 Tax=Flavihumibacter petaseus NBRC 106054 TaxID=1220578 RepID=A0A0E9MZF9_9BACT|nr:SusC/RagA family TonB-linked outer membrane protein [Flavihumibacter petaseus]GAO42898.1 putative TonB-dependent receptor [Flavihumibacter petaseus NBRC 106054]
MKKTISMLVLTLVTTIVFSQGRTVSGRVTDAKSGSPLAGVSVSVKDGTQATQTNNDGVYTLTGVPENARLIFTFISYKSFETRNAVGTKMDVTLEEEASQMNEVVVTANAIKREARSLGYATSTIKNDELTRSKDRSVLNSLQGKVAGVQITGSSGGVGSSTRIVFRGGTSMTGNNQALMVVDGIPIDNSQIDAGDNLNNQVDAGNRGNDLNPDDIESVTVLKGPAAAALYGSRASNGALIITTRSGKLKGGKRSEVSVSSAYNFDSILRLPEFQNEYGQGGKKEPDSRENFSWGPKMDGQMRPWGQQIGDSQLVKPYGPLPDNVKEFFNTGHTWTNAVSFSHNSDNAAYFISFNNLDQKGIMPGTEYKRTSVRLGVSSDLGHNFYSSASVNYVRSVGDLSTQGQGNSPYDQVLQTPRDIPLLELKDYHNKYNDLYGYYGAYTVNPYYFLGEDSYRTTMDRLLANVQIGYKPTKWLDINYRIGTDFSADKRRQIVSKRVITDPDNQNYPRRFSGKYEETAINIRELTSDLMITGKRKLTDDIGLSVLLGHNVRQRDFNSQISTANGLVVPFVYNLSNSLNRPTTSNEIINRRLWGLYADINLTYKNYLFLGITARNDWSSTLPEGDNSFFYPSANASFVFSELMPDQKVLTYGKLRASIAQVGNDAPPYVLRTVFKSGEVEDGYENSKVVFPLNSVPGYTLDDVIGNPNIKPEITTSFEVGVDLGFFRDRLALEATYYSNESRDQILTVPIAATSGYTSQTMNAGSITNKGIELLLRGTPVRTRDFSWEITGTFTKNTSKVKSLFPGVEQIELGGFVGATLVAKVGEPYGSFFGAGFLRDPDGNIVVDPNTGYPITDPVAKTHGNIQPDFLASVNNSFSYKGITLSFLFDAKKGGVFYSRTKSLQEFLGTDPRTLLNDREPFVIANSVVQTSDGKFEPNTKAVLDAQDYWTNYASDNAVESLLDASFIKLREVAVSYRIPKAWIKTWPVNYIQVGLSGRNLFLWTPSENTYADPETSSYGTSNIQGFEYGTIPSIRSYGANLKVVF